MAKENELRKLQARFIALTNRIVELKENQLKGYLDEGRYITLTAALDQERLEILFELKDIIKGHDKDIDTIFQDLINGENEVVLKQRLIQVAEEKGFRGVISKEIVNHKESIISLLIEIGIQIIKRMTPN
jgi:hypothetical protein